MIVKQYLTYGENHLNYSPYHSLNVCTHEKHEDFVILAIRLVRVLA